MPTGTQVSEDLKHIQLNKSIRNLAEVERKLEILLEKVEDVDTPENESAVSSEISLAETLSTAPNRIHACVTGIEQKIDKLHSLLF